MAVVSTAHSTATLFHHINGFKRFTFFLPFSSSSVAASLSTMKKWRQPVASSVLELGGIRIAKDDVVRDDPTNSVPDTIFSKHGMQLHRRNNQSLGILKNGMIYESFDINYSNIFDKFCDLWPIVSVKQYLTKDDLFLFSNFNSDYSIVGDSKYIGHCGLDFLFR
ncbi:phenylalanine--tRNA ligase, chloroplastic/mitochondrial-like isoform X2 [Durio zibethinus]|uniref:Phenylalanine--tRNA ligase, chloroplastic/mitochondrial-like isoform X2 n=1 Tax=Durio zibethinus TaxID=66656 RepID=A0A6P5X3G3_DURZI|nr:phenylalanine--tRNA ligase, chloroplastic/mitochondrial-like isoform X2 [Durio zibethinus]